MNDNSGRSCHERNIWSQRYLLQGPHNPFASLLISCILQNMWEESPFNRTTHIWCQVNCHIGELSHRKALSVAEFLGQECSARQPHTSKRHYITSVWYPLSRMLFQAMIMPNTGKQLQGLVGHIPSLWLCLQGCAGIGLRLGWWTIHSSVLLF